MAESRKISELITYGVLQPAGNKIYNSFLGIVGWSQATSLAKLAEAEEKVLSSVPEVAENINRRYVCINKNQYIWTLCLNAPASKKAVTPVVLLHGVASGSALWLLNMLSIATHRTVYAIDMLGFGRSSRVTFSVDPVVAEMELVESLEAWRQAVGLDTFILVGHCFGGFLGAAYAIRYPTRVRHLMLVDPWGFSEKTVVETADDERRIPVPLWVRSLVLLIQPFNPLSVLRLAGTWGPTLVAKFKPDLIKNFEHLMSGDTVAQYIYHWNAQIPSGETAFKHMSFEFGWARFPMINRIKDLAAFISVSVVCGSRSFIDTGLGQKILEIRRGSFVEVHTVSGAGHFVFAEKSEEFNNIFRQLCSLIDHRLDVLLPRSKSRSQMRRVRSECGPSSIMQTPSIGRRRRSQYICSEISEAPPAVASSLLMSATIDSDDDSERPVFAVSYEDP